MVKPEDVDSYQTVAVLNHFGFPVEVEEETTLRELTKYDMGFAKDDPYPLLLVDSSHPDLPSMEGAGLQSILSQLHNQGFIGQYLSHSAKES